VRTCARCGLTDDTVLDLDTGSACHPELLHCIRRLRERVEALEDLIRRAAYIDGGTLKRFVKFDGEHWGDEARRALSETEGQP
jgi:hypothetical protein